MIKFPRKSEYVRFKNQKRKIPFVIYADFESILVPEELVYIDDEFSKSFKSY